MYIGIDCGTQSIKAVVVEVENARILAEASHPHGLIQNSHGVNNGETNGPPL